MHTLRSGMPRVSICIDVSDLDVATAFYCEGLGCELVEKKAAHHTLSADGVTVHLGLKEPGSSATSSPGTGRSFERHWTPVHLDFDVEDVDEVAKRVTALGGTVEGDKRGAWGEAVFCADPFGNGFCLLHIDH